MGDILRLTIGASLLYTAMALPLDAQASVTPQPVAADTGLVDCALAPFKENTCDVTLPVGQDSLPFSVRVRLQHAPATPGDTARVTVGSSRCCVHPQVATVDRNGFVSITWRASRRSSEPVVVGFAANDGGTIRRDSLVIRPSTAAPRVVQVAPDDHAYVWVRGDRIPRLIPVRLASVGGSMDREACESVRVLFRARMESKADPDSTHPVWNPADNSCIAYTRWRLADDAGEQNMDVILGGNGTLTQDRTTITAFSRQTPRLTAGYGYFWNMKFEETVECEDVPTLPDCEGEAADEEVTRVRRDGKAAPYFALEMPIFFSTNPSNAVSRYLYRHTRLTIGTTFNRPEDNLFLGVTAFPIIFGASEASPFQVSAGVTMGGLKSPYLGLSLDATTIITPVLRAIGIPGL